MKSILWGLLVLFLLLSCETQTEQQKDGFSFGQPLKAQRNLTAHESAIAHNICSALEDKRLYFESQGNLELSFQTSHKSCAQEGYSSSKTVRARVQIPTRGPIRFLPLGRGRLLTDVLTDEQGILKEVCQKAFAGNTISNTLDLGNRKYQFHFKKIRGYDALELARYRRNQEGVFKPNLLEGYLFYTASTTNNSRERGIVYKRERALPCQNGQKLFRQIFKNYQ